MSGRSIWDVKNMKKNMFFFMFLILSVHMGREKKNMFFKIKKKLTKFKKVVNFFKTLSTFLVPLRNMTTSYSMNQN